MKGRVSLGHSNQVQYSGFNALWRYSYQHCWYLSINCLFSSLVVLAELTLFLLDNFSNINIGSVFFIRYNLYIFMFIFFQTPVKRIYKAFYFRGGWNPNLSLDSLLFILYIMRIYSLLFILNNLYILIFIFLDSCKTYLQSRLLERKVATRIYIGSVLFIGYNPYIFIFIFFSEICKTNLCSRLF